jgi:hypothetical protein
MIVSTGAVTAVGRCLVNPLRSSTYSACGNQLSSWMARFGDISANGDVVSHPSTGAGIDAPLATLRR